MAHAVLAQLVEHLPSKQGVASSRLVYRSTEKGFPVGIGTDQ